MVDTGTTHQGPQAGERNRRSPVKRFFSLLGPGLVTGASDDDPSGIATYAQAGASFRYGMLWAVLLTFPLMAATQMICDRMAQATGDSFGKLIRRRFSRGLRWVIGSLLAALIVANVVNLAADLMAIGQGMQLLHLGPAALWSGLAGAGILLAVVFGSFEQIGRIFKWLCLVLLVYVGVVVVANVNWHDVLRGFLGLNIRLTPAYLGLTVAVLGTTISPYMFFWQSADRIEQLRAEDLGGSHAPSLAERAPRARRRARRNSRIDVVAGMALSNLIMFSIIVATAATLGQNDQQVTSAADAAKALTPIAGQWSTVLFAVGFIGSGILAVPVLAASGAAGMAGLTDSSWGFDRSPRRAPLFYALIGVGIVVGILLSVVGLNPIRLLVLSAVVNGIAAGPFLLVMMVISSDRKIMGAYTNSRVSGVLGWATTAIMCVAGAYGVWYALAGG
jgi:NRAMP (natural resistance-associated macrophage protein)-like metal ion transporter